MPKLKFKYLPSPNFDQRNCAVDMIVLHYTGMKTGKQALDRLIDPAAKVSAHYLVEESGEIFALVDEQNRAWHAGVSIWQGKTETNDRSIGIEIVNPGHYWGYRDFTTKQIQFVMSLVEEISIRHSINPALVVGHSDVAPNRKEDPGEKFPWEELAKQGLSIGQYKEEYLTKESDYEAALSQLKEIGYGLEGVNHSSTVLAFQRRFYPQALGQGLNPKTRSAINWVNQQVKQALN